MDAIRLSFKSLISLGLIFPELRIRMSLRACNVVVQHLALVSDWMLIMYRQMIRREKYCVVTSSSLWVLSVRR